MRSEHKTTGDERHAWGRYADNKNRKQIKKLSHKKDRQIAKRTATQ